MVHSRKVRAGSVSSLIPTCMAFPAACLLGRISLQAKDLRQEGPESAPPVYPDAKEQYAHLMGSLHQTALSHILLESR